jgi:hypothetical protein
MAIWFAFFDQRGCGVRSVEPQMGAPDRDEGSFRAPCKDQAREQTVPDLRVPGAARLWPGDGGRLGLGRWHARLRAASVTAMASLTATAEKSLPDWAVYEMSAGFRSR